ncbi:hypothetical protein [Rhizobium sp. NRK18]|uniref:hypothetical protein n=1 Tax=Rhizobium sp. NRK18 TaxID=2964667 RepID=UPI0021C40982|nr:hypothetical protein [Rhizobium sp. NRK18]MCQ2006292.1 hypothetical protein [Rhizobium sp. NRK18]
MDVVTLGPRISLLLAARSQPTGTSSKPSPPPVYPRAQAIYGERQYGEDTIPAVDVSKIDPRNIRQIVNHRGSGAPGTIVVDPHARIHYLYQDIIDLYARVPEGSRMVVLTAKESGKGEF